jgi:AbrB family looped-hinge helix DNA binding protein
MRMTSKGQITIPIEIREKLGLLPNTEVEFEIDRDAVRVKKAARQGPLSRGQALVDHMRGKGTRRITTDEIMRLTRGWKVTATLADSNVILDVLTEDEQWFDWSAAALAAAATRGPLLINPIVYAEVSAGFERIEDLDEALPQLYYRRVPLPWEAAFLAGQCYIKYRRRGGPRRSPMPDFYIGAHAAIEGLTLLTRDPKRYRAYFPTLRLVAP